MFELRTLGTLDLRGSADGRSAGSILTQPKRAAVLVSLVMGGLRGRARDSLLAMFWPEAAEPRARRALNQTLYVLRSALGEDAVQSVGEQVLLSPGVVESDVVRFEAALDAGRAEQALGVYAGDFLEGFYLDDAPDFERWVGGERERLRRRALVAALSLADGESRAGNPAGTLRWLERARALAPYDEQVLQRLLRTMGALGDRSGAALEYRAFEERLAAELALEPAPATRELVERIAATPPPDLAGTRAGDLGEPRPAPAGPAPGGARRRRWAGAAALAAATVLVLVTVFAARARQPAVSAEPARDPAALPRVLIMDLRNDTGDPSLEAVGRIAADWTAQGIARIGGIEVIPASLAPPEPLVVRTNAAGPLGPDPAELRNLREWSRSDYLLWGSYVLERDTLIIQATITETASGRLLRAVSPVRAHVLEPMTAVHELQARLAGALATLLDARIADWAGAASQPPTFEAYRLFTDGLDRIAAEEYEAAVAVFLRAAAADSSFTTPIVWAIHSLGWGLDRSREVDSLVETLSPRRNQLAPWDRAVVDYYRAWAVHNWRDAHVAAARLAGLVPRSDWTYPAVRAARMRGRPREALQRLDALGSEPAEHWDRYWTNRLSALHQLGDYAGELKGVSAARGDRPDCCVLEELRALAAAGRAKEVLRRLDGHLADMADPGRRAWILAITADELLAHGLPTPSRDLAERALALRLAEPRPVTAEAQFGLANALFRAGRHEEARPLYEAAHAGRPDLGADKFLALVAAARGDREDARHLTAEFSAQTPWRHSEFLRIIWQARLLAALGDRDQAVAVLARGLEEGRVGHYIWLHADPHLAPLFDHPAFQALFEPRG